MMFSLHEGCGYDPGLWRAWEATLAAGNRVELAPLGATELHFAAGRVIQSGGEAGKIRQGIAVRDFEDREFPLVEREIESIVVRFIRRVRCVHRHGLETQHL